MMLTEEQGCELDRGRISEVFYDLMIRTPYDRERLYGMIGTGGERKVWETVLATLLSGDEENLKAVCDKVARSPFYKELLKAYLMLCGARAKK